MKVVLIPGMGCTPVARSNWYSWLARRCNNDRTDGLKDIHCNLQDFPDPYQCRESIWLPFVESIISPSTSDNDDENNDRNDRSNINASRREDTIVIGHSSGAACAMRLMEKYGQENLQNASSSSSSSSSSPQPQSKLAGVILVAAAYTDLNDEDERRSEYFNREWDWEAMKYGSKQTVLFHGSDDHLIPVSEARYIASKLGSKDDDSDDEEQSTTAATTSSSKEHNFKYIEMDGKSHFFEPWPEILEVLEELATSQSVPVKE